MTLYLLASTRSRYEFGVADAINAMGALAVVPRQVQITAAKDGKPERIDYTPLLPRLLFVACTDRQWYDMHDGRMMGPQGMLPPVRRELEILPRTWGDFQEFAARAEQECEHRRGTHEAGRKVRNYRPGDILRIIGSDLLGGQLHEHMGRFVKMDGAKVVVQTDVVIMGKAVTARLDPVQVMGIAAE